MSGEQVVGHVSWSPDFKAQQDNKIQKMLNDGTVKLAPRFDNGVLVSVDLVRGDPIEPVVEDAIQVDVRPHQQEKPSPLALIGTGTPAPEVEFTYTNWKGETKQRKAVFTTLFWGSNEWHKDPQLLIYGYDLDKKAPRTYAVKDISNLTPINAR